MPTYGYIRGFGSGHAVHHSDAAALPSSYTQGTGFTFTTPAKESNAVENQLVALLNGAGNRANAGGTEYALAPSVTADGNVQVLVYALDTTAATPAWAEVAAGTDLSNLTAVLHADIA